MRAAVVGGSLGGLTAALLLHDLGIDVDVYERSPAALMQRGAGIGFLPESARYLVERAGVALDRVSVATAHIRYLDRHGGVIYDGRHSYRFSSWNTVYREAPGVPPRALPPRPRDDGMARGWRRGGGPPGRPSRTPG